MHPKQRHDSTRTRWRALALVLALGLALASPAPAQEPGQDAKNYDQLGTVQPGVDVLILRPLGLLATITGTALFVASAPFVLITRPTQIGVPFNYLVVRPARYTWVDPLGEHPEPLL